MGRVAGEWALFRETILAFDESRGGAETALEDLERIAPVGFQLRFPLLVRQHEHDVGNDSRPIVVMLVLIQLVLDVFVGRPAL
jgi:hypothetical protein